MDQDATFTGVSPLSAEFADLRSERDVRAGVAADLYESAAHDGHRLFNAACRRNAARFRDRAFSLLKGCP